MITRLPSPPAQIEQGRITKVLNTLSMKPIETLRMIEEAAGTRMFEMKMKDAISAIKEEFPALRVSSREMLRRQESVIDQLAQEKNEALHTAWTKARLARVARVAEAYVTTPHCLGIVLKWECHPLCAGERNFWLDFLDAPAGRSLLGEAGAAGWLRHRGGRGHQGGPIKVDPVISVGAVSRLDLASFHRRAQL